MPSSADGARHPFCTATREFILIFLHRAGAAVPLGGTCRRLSSISAFPLVFVPHFVSDRAYNTGSAVYHADT